MAADFVRPMGVQPPDDRPIKESGKMHRAMLRYAASIIRVRADFGHVLRYGPTEHGIDRFDGGEYVNLADVLRLLEEG